MKINHLPILFALASCVFSCGSKKSDPQSPIVAKWTLQKEHVVLVEDNAKQMDTIITPLGSTNASVEFKSDGSYSSSSVYVTDPNSLSSIIAPSNSNNTGTYIYKSNSFSVSAGLSGWYVFVVGASAPASGYTYTAEVTSINSTSLNIHTNSTVTITNTGTHNYVEDLYFYYTK